MILDSVLRIFEDALLEFAAGKGIFGFVLNFSDP